eukprot:COSAG03_NODE_148_length_11571_cov_9.471583_2_plen_220_part_00
MERGGARCAVVRSCGIDERCAAAVVHATDTVLSASRAAAEARMTTADGSPKSWYTADDWKPLAPWPRADSHIHLVRVDSATAGLSRTVSTPVSFVWQSCAVAVAAGQGTGWLCGTGAAGAPLVGGRKRGRGRDRDRRAEGLSVCLSVSLSVSLSLSLSLRLTLSLSLPLRLTTFTRGRMGSQPRSLWQLATTTTRSSAPRRRSSAGCGRCWPSIPRSSA